MSLLQPVVNRSYDIGQAHGYLLKAGAAATASPVLSGRLYLSQSGWLLLSVPNGMVRGIFSTLNEEGLELPPGKNGNPYNAHISVMRQEEVEALGGGDKITERGKVFHYQLGPLKVVDPLGWEEISKCWFIEVKSPELQNLRKSYGLSGLPQKNGEELPFHITVAVRRKHVLRENEVSKAAADSHYLNAVRSTPLQWRSEAGFLGNILQHLRSIKERGDRSINEAYGANRVRTALLPPLQRLDAQQQEFLQALNGHDPVVQHPVDKVLQSPLLKGASDDLDMLSQAKAHSDMRNYDAKHAVLRRLMRNNPGAWRVDSRQRGMVGVTHRSGYRFHVPPGVAKAISSGA